MSSSAASARRGSCLTSDSTALMLLNRKCGRMRACSACNRASASAGDSARPRRSKYASSISVTSTTTTIQRVKEAGSTISNQWLA